MPVVLITAKNKTNLTTARQIKPIISSWLPNSKPPNIQSFWMMLFVHLKYSKTNLFFLISS